nr:MAG TPA: hypothetical protein [Caudoviricetes sp.]
MISIFLGILGLWRSDYALIIKLGICKICFIFHITYTNDSIC